MGANVVAQDELPKVRQITPNSIRVEPLTQQGTGGWITLGGFAEIGSPAISPDNEWVAFDGREKGFGKSPAEIWVARRDGSKLHKLVTGATPRWSPDGSKIIFSRRNAQEVSFIRVINADGTGEKPLGEGGWPDWSPDGTQIVFSRDGKTGGGAKVLSRVYIAKSDGTEPKLIAAGDCPSWSPDGKRIACCYRDPAMSCSVDSRRRIGQWMGTFRRGRLVPGQLEFGQPAFGNEQHCRSSANRDGGA